MQIYLKKYNRKLTQVEKDEMLSQKIKNKYQKFDYYTDKNKTLIISIDSYFFQ